MTLYTDYDEMLKHPQLQAVVIATVTTVHAEQAIKAMEANLHVLCEKPLSTSVEVVRMLATNSSSLASPCETPEWKNTPPLIYLYTPQSQSVVDTAKKHPHLKVMCGFSRRFDASYRDAWERMDSGSIGRPSIIRSQTCDKLDPSGFFVEYARFSGGIFVDCNIHDIDLALWYFGADSVVKSVSAVGITAVQPALRKYHDVDNGVGVVEFWGGKVAYFYSSRMMAAGQHDMTEIIGTEGKISVNANPQGTLVEMSEKGGVRREIPQDYYGRFEQAFVTEANEFTACCLDGTKVPLKLSGAVQAVRIGCALQEALNRGVKIDFDENGKRVERARL